MFAMCKSLNFVSDIKWQDLETAARGGRLTLPEMLIN